MFYLALFFVLYFLQVTSAATRISGFGVTCHNTIEQCQQNCSSPLVCYSVTLCNDQAVDRVACWIPMLWFVIGLLLFLALVNAAIWIPCCCCPCCPIRKAIKRKQEQKRIAIANSRQQ